MEAEAAAALFKQHLAYADRRSLSQAWYSALHLSEREPAARFSRALQLPAPASGRARAERSAGTPQHAAELRSPRGRAPHALAPRPAAPPNVASGRSARGVPPVQPTARRPLQAAGTALTMTFGGSRVHLLLRRGGDGLSVVALCAARQAGSVRAALGEAQRSLISCGEQVRCNVVALEAVR